MSQAAFILAILAIALHAYQMTLNYLGKRNGKSQAPPQFPAPAQANDLPAEARPANAQYQPSRLRRARISQILRSRSRP